MGTVAIIAPAAAVRAERHEPVDAVMGAEVEQEDLVVAEAVAARAGEVGVHHAERAVVAEGGAAVAVDMAEAVGVAATAVVVEVTAVCLRKATRKGAAIKNF